MRECIEIQGGRALEGTVRVGGAKNAALPQIIACLMTSDRVVLNNIPNIEDIHVLAALLEHFGGEVSYSNGTLEANVPQLIASEASYSLVKALRASFWVLAPLLARGGAARVALPGGDIIGARPVDLHLQGLTQMGADIAVKHGIVYATAPNGLRPADIHLRFPSVGATHQLLMAAALTKGRTVIRGAAREPEVVALAQMIAGMGAAVEGAGEDIIAIDGRERLQGGTFDIIGDRIEAGTYALPAAMTGGKVRLQNFNQRHFGEFTAILQQLGVELHCSEEGLDVIGPKRLYALHIETKPFPGFATDLQAPLIAALTIAGGRSTLVENIFEGRFAHVSELCRMGAKISVSDRTVTIDGVERLSGAPVDGNDIRAAAALAIAALAAEGTSEIYEVHHIRRGYENFESKLRALGGRVALKITDAEDVRFAGC